MRKNSYICLLCIYLLMNFPENIFGQCAIDSTQTIAGVYPNVLPDATAGQYYSTDITFVLLLDTLGLPITNYHITTVTGLPIGLNWQCNNYANGCNYDPTVNLYGCANMSGTPLIPGSYVAHVTVIASISVVGDQTVDYPLPITVLPAQTTNNGFSMTNSSGCDPLTVSFTNNDPGQLSYQWDFGDGIQSNLENPVPHTYTIPGDYIVTQTVIPNIQPDYYLTSVTVNSIPDNYGGPIDDPDMYLLIDNATGTTVFDSRPAQNGLFPPQTWGIPNILLANENYTIHVWDEDGGLFGADDDLGVISFAGHGTSGNATATVGGATGSLNLDYVIFQTPVNAIITTDTIHVFPSQQMPVLTLNGNTSFCEGDSLVLTSSEPIGNQWYVDSTILSGDTNTTYVVTQSGLYFLTVTNSFGCSATAYMTDTVHVYGNPPHPNILIAGDTLKCLLTGYNYQWLLNDTVLAGETNSYVVPLVSGNYSILISTNQGCADTSQVLFFTYTGINNGGVQSADILIYPNPANKTLHVECDQCNAAYLSMKDVTGKTVFEKDLISQESHLHETIDVSGLEKGIYFLELNVGGKNVARKIILR
ncbi:MAG: T9SS type A sorting domain-containing protein [Bacteroidota bacterium]